MPRSWRASGQPTRSPCSARAPSVCWLLTARSSGEPARCIRSTWSMSGSTRPGRWDLFLSTPARALSLTSGTYVRLREIRRDDRHGVCGLFGVPVLPLERCPAGGPGGPVPVGGLSEDLADEQGDGVVSAGGALAAVRAAGIGGDVAADEGQHGGERDEAGVEAGLAGGAGGEGGGHVVHEQQRPGFLPRECGRASSQHAAGSFD